MGWRGIKNGELLERAAEAGFDALITRDRHIPHQQNLQHLPCTLIVIRTRSLRGEALHQVVRELQKALGQFKKCAVMHIEG